MKSASSPRTTPAASAGGAASADGAASPPQHTPAAGTPPRRRPRWRLIAGSLLTFGLCLGAALLAKREHQRQAALTLLQDCGCKAMAWHSPWGRVPSNEALDWDELRSRAFLYPDVIITPEVYLGQVEELERLKNHAIYQRLGLPDESQDNEDSEDDADSEASEDKRLLKDLHKSDPLKLLAALQVLRPKMLIMRWSQPQAPAFWRRLAQVTSLEGLMVTAWWGGFDDRALQQITRLPRLSTLMITNFTRTSSITDASLTCLQSCPQLQTLSLQGTQVTRAGALDCLRRCPQLLIKLNGEGVPRR